MSAVLVFYMDLESEINFNKIIFLILLLSSSIMSLYYDVLFSKMTCVIYRSRDHKFVLTCDCLIKLLIITLIV